MAGVILLYYFVSIKSLLSTTLQVLLSESSFVASTELTVKIEFGC